MHPLISLIQNRLSEARRVKWSAVMCGNLLAMCGFHENDWLMLFVYSVQTQIGHTFFPSVDIDAVEKSVIIDVKF